MSYPNSVMRRPNPLIIIINDLPSIPPTEMRRTSQQQLRNMAQVMSIPQPERKFRSYVRRVPIFGPAAIVGMGVAELTRWFKDTTSLNMNGWTRYGQWPGSYSPTHMEWHTNNPDTASFRLWTNYANQGLITGYASAFDWPRAPGADPNDSMRRLTLYDASYGAENTARVVENWGRYTDAARYPEWETQTVPRYMPAFEPQFAPYATFYPPLLNPPAVAPWLTYGYGGERKHKLMPEDSEAGYEKDAIYERTEPNPPWLMSEPPPAGTKEKKIRITDRALGALVQRVVGGSTEGLDYAWAFFNSLPMYLRYKAFNHFRRVEVRGNDGFIKEARLHYVALTPVQMIKWTLDHIDEMDPANLLTNILAMQGSDRAWGSIGRAMGRYARGPWDEPLPNGPNASDWEPFVEFVTENYFHNEELLNDLARQYNLTREEMRIINNRFRKYREQNPGYEPPIIL